MCVHMSSLHTAGMHDVAWSQAQSGAIGLVKFMVLLLHKLYVIKRLETSEVSIINMLMGKGQMQISKDTHYASGTVKKAPRHLWRRSLVNH